MNRLNNFMKGGGIVRLFRWRTPTLPSYAPTRGIVAGPRIESRDGKGVLTPTKLPELLFYVTYWDRIDLPVVQGLSISSPETAGYFEVLGAEGVLSRTDVEYRAPKEVDSSGGSVMGLPDSIFMRANIQAPFDVCNRLSREMDISWTVGQSTTQSAAELLAPKQEDQERREVMALHLMKALPVPAASTAPKALLKFTHRRRSELLAFRAAFDALCEAATAEAPLVKEITRGRERLQAVLIDLHRVLDESRIERVAGSIKTYLSLGDLEANKILFPVIGAAGAGVAQVSPVWGALGGLGANAALTFATRKIYKPSALPAEIRDFAYLYYVDSLR